jgi:putative hemolysin
VLGELVPKTISLERASQAALIIARPFSLYLKTFQPAILLLDGMSRAVVKALGVQPPTAGHTVPHSSEELEIQIRQAREHGLLDPGEEHSMLGALELGDVRVREIMVPRPDMHALPVDATLDDTMKLLAATQRSRIPVYEGSLDHILGFVHIKDVVWILIDRARASQEDGAGAEFHLRNLLREALIVPETKPASELLVEFRAKRVGLAMIVDEFGSILGLTTLEDVLEEMVGDIHDEFDVVERPHVLPEGELVFDGSIAVRELETQYNIALPEDPAYETLGGFILNRLGFIPRGGEGFEADGYRFTVLEMDRRRVARVKIKPLPPPATQDPGNEQSLAAHSASQESPKTGAREAS